jgi:capsular exopolysaccharide synthesis family protein
MDLRDYLQVMRRRWRIVACGFFVVLAVAAVMTIRTTPQYESQAQVFISTQDSSGENAYQGGMFSSQRVTSYASLVTSRDLANRVIDELGLDLTPAELAAKVTAQVVPETVLLTLTVRDSNPEFAQDLAQGYTEELSKLVDELETPPGKREPVLKATTVESADLPSSPVEPNAVRNLGLGAVLGLLVGIGLAALREILDTSVKTAEDVAAQAHTSVLAWIGHDPHTQSKPLVSDLGPHEPRVEAYRVLRTNLQFIDVDAPNKAFVVTSALPGEGKTTTAVNVALTLAMAGSRVLLVDGDLRRPRLAGLLGLEGMIGLTSVIVGSVDLDTAIQHHPSGLEVLTSGPVPPNPAELLQSQSTTDLIAGLRDRYDVVIFDAPPLLPVTDAALLSSATDGALIVVRHSHTSRDQLHGAYERLAQVGAQPLGVVLNRVPRKKGAGGYGAYGYGYGYAPDAAGSPGAEGKRRADRPRQAKVPKPPKAPRYATPERDTAEAARPQAPDLDQLMDPPAAQAPRAFDVTEATQPRPRRPRA